MADVTTGVLVERAKAGDRYALEEVVRAVQDDVYNLAIRMLWHPEDAEDATQEILLRVVTHLGGFRGDSGFRTWVVRVASNYLLTTRRRRAEDPELTFERFGEDLAEGLADGAAWQEAEPERRLEIEEVKIGCSQAMLLCLDREHRLAYVLGEILELSGPEAAAVLEITPAAFRKRLSRARQRVEAFMRGHCGLANPASRCRCHKRVDRAKQLGRLAPGRLLFASHPVHGPRDPDPFLAGKHAVEELRDVAGRIQRSNPDYAAPGGALETIRSLLRSDRMRVLRTGETG